MIAGEEFNPDAKRSINAQPLDDLGRLGTAIDQIAEEDDGHFGRTASGNVGFDHRDQRAEQIVMPVDVADGV